MSVNFKELLNGSLTSLVSHLIESIDGNKIISMEVSDSSLDHDVVKFAAVSENIKGMKYGVAKIYPPDDMYTMNVHLCFDKEIVTRRDIDHPIDKAFFTKEAVQKMFGTEDVIETGSGSSANGDDDFVYEVKVGENNYEEIEVVYDDFGNITLHLYNYEEDPYVPMSKQSLMISEDIFASDSESGNTHKDILEPELRALIDNSEHIISRKEGFSAFYREIPNIEEAVKKEFPNKNYKLLYSMGFPDGSVRFNYSIFEGEDVVASFIGICSPKGRHISGGSDLRDTRTYLNLFQKELKK